ncbi:hypothetical protein HDE78_000596 [Rhodanobacter sp. K2T2]|uniref:XAC0095 family protein n=1 Tax=Rhodanobacter sp. K2T2 TaxID=2723085 RepID=UPI0015CDEDB9|nr:hypothetical protein [Rhodanobacter sp. K2T2]NYE27671.1 hypothetical protein [Rhodanobacter sp. K2T2]
MSTFDTDDRDTRGYFLPANSQRRLQKLRDYAEFLTHIAQPRTPDAEQEGAPAINAEQVAICLEFLVEQMGLVLSDLSFPAPRAENDAIPAADETPYATEAVPDDVSERYPFGITLDQIDTLNRLIDMITAHGDVITTTPATELADHTLSLLGHAIFTDASAVRDLIDQIESQHLNPPHHPPTGVGEAQAVYRIERESSRVH